MTLPSSEEERDHSARAACRRDAISIPAAAIQPARNLKCVLGRTIELMRAFSMMLDITASVKCPIADDDYRRRGSLSAPPFNTAEGIRAAHEKGTLHRHRRFRPRRAKRAFRPAAVGSVSTGDSDMIVLLRPWYISRRGFAFEIGQHIKSDGQENARCCFSRVS